MKIWKLVSGIISIVLSAVVVYQSRAASIIDRIANNLFDVGSYSGTVGYIVAVLMVAGGIISIVNRKGNKIGDISAAAIFGIAAILGYTMGGIYKDLIIWSTWCIVCAIIAIISFVRKPEEVPSRHAPAPRPSQPQPFTLTARDLATEDGMMTYCQTFGFQAGASDDLCRVLFTAAEHAVAPDNQVLTAFIASNDYQSAASNSGFCAVVFAASKVIVSRSGGCDVYPVPEINAFRSHPSDSKTVILMEHQAGVCRFGVDPSKAAGILGCCTSALEDCKKSILEEQGAMP